MPARHTYQLQVETLLDQIQRQVRELRQLKTVGATSRALADRKQRLQRTREQLASLVAGGEPAAVRAA